MKTMFLNRAIAAAVAEEMRRDSSVVLMGTDVINQCGAFSTYLGVAEEFPDRVLDMPICELGFTHFATGAAMIGMRPVVEIGFSDFATLASDCIINTASKYRFSTLGTRSLPIVYAMGNGSRGVYGGWSTGCNHDQCTETLFQNTAGLKILVPFYPGDAKALLKAAIRDDDPVVYYYHLASGGMKGEVNEDPNYIIPINGAANVVRKGKDCTVVALQAMLPAAEQAAEELLQEGIDIEIIDPRVIVPLDKDKICSSVNKTGRVLIAHESPVRGGVGGEIAAVIAENCFRTLKAPIRRLGQLSCPGPAGPLEYLMQPKAEDIVRIVKELVKE